MSHRETKVLHQRQGFSNRSPDTHLTPARTKTGTGSSLIDVRQIRLATKTTKPKQSEINLTNYTFNSIFFDHNVMQNSLKHSSWFTEKKSTQTTNKTLRNIDLLCLEIKVVLLSDRSVFVTFYII